MSNCKCGFCHLHVHSEYSLLDGANRVKDLAKRAAAMDMPALALTDHGVMYGAIDHYEACMAEGIKPIIGCETYVAPRKHTDKDPHLDSQKNTCHLTLWAKNNAGYRNLVKLITQANLHGFYYRPRVDHALLAQYAEGIICGSACLGGEIPQLIIGQRFDEAVQRAEMYREMFGKENFFLELMDHDLTGQAEVNEKVVDIHHKTGIPLIVSNDAHFLRREDEQMHKILVCIGTNSTLDKAALHYGPNFYLKSQDEMWERFKHVPEALENTLRIADMVDLKLDLKSTHFPDFDVPPGHDLVSYLRELCKQRFPSRYPAGSPRHEEATRRMEYELGVIISKGYAGYFLVVQDFINWAKERGILVGCRGSAAGCLVSYVLGITNLDPLPYGLLFERFLNPDRVSTPDIDVDFPDKRREEVMDYVTGKYGKDKVAQIITFGTLAARAAVRDCARAMGIDLKVADAVAKLIPNVPGHPVSIKEAIEQVRELSDLCSSDTTVRELCETAQGIEGFTRHASRHACGVVIGQTPLDDLVPLAEKDGDIITQYHAKALEKIGLVKMDFLGMQNNTVINDTVDLIEARRGDKIDLENIDLTDKKVYDMLGRGDSVAVFQMEGTGMRSLLRELRPENLEHIIAQISLYRPGPMEEIPTYVRGRHGGAVTYPHPLLEPVLKETYGMLLYQEQVMKAAQVLAGFTGGQAETLMKAMSKKKADDMAKLKPLFIEGCLANKIDNKSANYIFGRMEEFAKYAFNKSHAAYYGLVAYWTAYLKVNFTPEYMASRMSSVLGSKDKLLVVIDDCRKRGIQVLPPDVNESNHEFTVVGPIEGADIRFGLQAIKGVGEAAVNAVLAARREGGRFVSLHDFCERVPSRECGKSVLETLIKCGAFDSLHPNRQAALHGLAGAMEAGAKALADTVSGQVNLFAEPANEVGRPKATGQLPDVPDADRETRLVWEKELLGMYISDHPLLPLRPFLESKTTAMERIGEDRALTDGTRVTLGGLVTTIKKMVDKNGRTWVAFTLEDLTGSIEILAFSKTYEKCGSCVELDAKLLVTGKLAADTRGGNRGQHTEDEEGGEAELVRYKVMADEIEVIDAAQAAQEEAPARRTVTVGAEPSVAEAASATSTTGGANARPSNGAGASSSLAPPLPTPAFNDQQQFNNGHSTHANGASNGHGSLAPGAASPGSGDEMGEGMPPEPARIARGFDPPSWARDCVHLHVPEERATAAILGKLWNICKTYHGETEVWLHIDNGSETLQLRASRAFRVRSCPEFHRDMAEVLGEEAVLVPRHAY